MLVYGRSQHYPGTDSADVCGECEARRSLSRTRVTSCDAALEKARLACAGRAGSLDGLIGHSITYRNAVGPEGRGSGQRRWRSARAVRPGAPRGVQRPGARRRQPVRARRRNGMRTGLAGKVDGIHPQHSGPSAPPDREAGELSPRGLPHHRRCGSAYRGSTDTLEPPSGIHQRDQPRVCEVRARQRRVHVRGPCIPPRTAPIQGTAQGSGVVEPELPQFRRPSRWTLSRPPEHTAQAPPQPLVEGLEGPQVPGRGL